MTEAARCEYDQPSLGLDVQELRIRRVYSIFRREECFFRMKNEMALAWRASRIRHGVPGFDKGAELC
jgi:hypothetical protein